MTTFKKEISDEAKRFKLIRKNEKLTQQEFGEILGKSQPHIRRYEFGEAYIPTAIYKILHERLGYTYEWLLSGTGTKKVVESKKTDLLVDIKTLRDKLELVTHNYEVLNKKMNKIYRDFYAQRGQERGEKGAE